MPNTFIGLDVPRVSNGAGAPMLVGATGHPKSLVAAGPITGRYVVEGSNDGGTTWDILKDDNDGTEALFTSDSSGAKSVDCIVERVRVRSIRAVATSNPPTMTLGAPPALGTNFFGKLDVPQSPGQGGILDLGLGVGPLKTFILRGTVPERGRFTILASMDGLRFDEAMLFTADQQGARSVRVMCRYLRVQRSGAAGTPPVVAVGCEPVVEAVGDGGGGGGGTQGPIGPFISFGDESAKTTTSLDAEEVIEEFVVPGSSLPAAARSVVFWFSGLARKASATGEGDVTLRLRRGGQSREPDGDVLASTNISSAVEAPCSGRSNPADRTELVLIKLTAQGNGVTRPIVRGLTVYMEPAPGSVFG